MISKIKSIRKIECKSKRYDLQTSTHNFFANGMLVHNSLLSLYHDGEKWCVSTRKLAFAEGSTNMGPTFDQMFRQAAAKTRLFESLEKSVGVKDLTLVFELTGPENRIVTRYEESGITLIGGRCNQEEYNYRELSSTELDNIAISANVNRPKIYKASSLEELITLVESFHTLDEGVVLIVENMDGSHWRVKCKNPKYVAVAHLRENGGLSPKNVLQLIMSGDEEEYILHFPEDKKYFDFVETVYAEVKQRITALYDECKDIKEQKDFALTMMPKTRYSFEKGTLFSMRKGEELGSLLKDIGAKKIADNLNLKQKFIDEFHVTIEDAS